MRLEDMAAQMVKNAGIPPAFVAKTLFNDSEPVKKLPKTLFHASPLKNFDSIIEIGLRPHELYGQIYLCETVEQCLRFVKGPCVVVEINPRNLNIKKMVYSKDHNRLVYDFDCFVYYKKILPSGLKGWSLHNIEKIKP